MLATTCHNPQACLRTYNSFLGEYLELQPQGYLDFPLLLSDCMPNDSLLIRNTLSVCLSAGDKETLSSVFTYDERLRDNRTSHIPVSSLSLPRPLLYKANKNWQSLVGWI